MSETYAKDVTCSVCAFTMDHPVDSCPVCGEPFYWLVIAKTPPSESQKTAFFQIMEDLVEGNVDRRFLQHGDHLWLPHNFWQYCSDGQILESFPWLLDIRLVQRPNPQKKQFFLNKPTPQEELRVAPEVRSVPSDADERDEDSDDTQPMPIVPPEDQPVASVVVTRWSWDLVYRPLMVALLFVFLIASYFTLLYHRNTRSPTGKKVPEVRHEEQILP